MFSEFSPPGRVWAEFGFNILLSLSWPISSYLIPFWLQLMPGSCFLIFWIFLLFFFCNFLPRVEYERNSGQKLFSTLSAYLILSRPVFAKNNNRKLFFNFFEFFCYFFSEFSPPGRVWAELGSKIVFSLSRPVSSQFG